MSDDIISIAHRYGEDDRILAEETATCLRQWLEMAEAGELISVAIAGELANGGVCTGHTAGTRRYCVLGALNVVQAELVKINTEDES